MAEETDIFAYEQEPDGHIRMTWETLARSISTEKTYKRTEFGEKLANILRFASETDK